MAEYKIGEVFKISEDVELKTAITNEPKLIKKGTKIVIGADRLAHHVYSGIIQPLEKDSIVKGYNSYGIAKVICMILEHDFSLSDMLSDNSIDEDDFIESIAECLSDRLGMG